MKPFGIYESSINGPWKLLDQFSSVSSIFSKVCGLVVSTDPKSVSNQEKNDLWMFIERKINQHQNHSPEINAIKHFSI